MKSAIPGVDGSQFHLLVDQPAILESAGDFDDHIIACDGGSPEHAGVLEVVDGEGTNSVGPIDVVEIHLALYRYEPAAESEVHADGILATGAKTPHCSLVIQLAPLSVGRRTDVDRLRNGITRSHPGSVALDVFQSQRLDVQGWDLDDWHILQRDVSTGQGGSEQ